MSSLNQWQASCGLVVALSTGILPGLTLGYPMSPQSSVNDSLPMSDARTKSQQRDSVLGATVDSVRIVPQRRT